MIKTIFLILLVILSTSQKGITKKQLNEKMIEFNMSPLVSLLLVYDTLSPRADVLQMLMNSIAEKRKGYFNVIMFDCNTDDQEVLAEFIYCQDQYRKHLPALIFSQPTLNHDMKHQTNLLSGVKQYQGPLEDKSLFNFAVPLMKTYSVELKTRKDLKKFEQSYPDVPKVIFITDKQKINPLFRALTAHFRNTIVFGHVFSTSVIAKDLNITKFPIFLINGKDRMEVKSNLTEIINRFQMIKGQPTKIFIREFQSSDNAQLNQKNLEELVFKTAQHILIHVIGEDGKQHPQWNNFTLKYYKMFKFYETETLKEALGVKSTPAIVYFPKSIAKKAVQKTVFTTKHTFQDIYNQIYSIVQDFTVPLTNFLQLQKMTSIHFQEGKFVVIYFHSKEIPLSYKAVSNQKVFQEDLAFFRMKDPEKDVLDQYQITKLPALIIMMVDDEPDSQKTQKKNEKDDQKSVKLRLATYRGKFTYSDLHNFFSSFNKKSIQNKIDQQQTEQVQSINKKIQQIKKQNRLKNKCSQACFLLLINGSPENSEKNKNYINILQKQSGRMFGNNFAYIDGVCHSQFLGTFQVLEDELPTLIYIDPKFEKYSRMVGRLQQSSISGFFSKIKSRKANFRGYDRLKFENKNCIDQHQKLKKLSQNSSTISDQQAAILQQLRAQQQRKREQFSKAQKDDKIRKKNKKKKPKKQQQFEEL